MRRIKTRYWLRTALLLLAGFCCSSQADETEYIVEAGHPSLAVWLLPTSSASIQTDQEKIALGRTLFFDPILSNNKDMSCATCHNPQLGWADGLPKAIGDQGLELDRATPTIINAVFNTIFMWDGRSPSLSHQALLPITSSKEMNLTTDELLTRMNNSVYYSREFQRVFKQKRVTLGNIADALSAFESTIISNNTRFDRWVKGDKTALTSREINGFKIFLDESKGNCAACHHPPNFTDDGFHNIGLGNADNDVGRYQLVPIKSMYGAFKTPPLRNIADLAPYFHDGSAKDLMEVVELYEQGGMDKSNLSPNMKALELTLEDKKDIVAFLQSLSPTKE